MFLLVGAMCHVFCLFTVERKHQSVMDGESIMLEYTNILWMTYYIRFRQSFVVCQATRHDGKMYQYPGTGV